MNRLVDTGRKYGIEIKIDKSQVMRVSRSNESLQIKVGNRKLKEVDHFMLHTMIYCILLKNESDDIEIC